MDKSIVWADADSDLSIFSQAELDEFATSGAQTSLSLVEPLCHLCNEVMMIVAGGSCAQTSRLISLFFGRQIANPPQEIVLSHRYPGHGQSTSRA